MQLGTLEKIVSCFKDVTIAELEKEIKKLSSVKDASVKKDADIFADVLCKRINATFKPSMFPNSLKVADITPLHKKAKITYKNYRPVSILPFLSKVLERIMFAQISAFLTIFSQNNNADSKRL